MECLNCGLITDNPKFCCNGCSVSYNNSNNHWRKKRGIIKTKPICIFCGIECKNYKSKFCSSKCQHTHSMIESVFNKTASPRTIKKYLIYSEGNKCGVCGITEWNNKPIVMDLEHIDGNSDNNELENLCIICPNCHSQTNTYNGKNVGNGRHSRRVRYQEKKSY